MDIKQLNEELTKLIEAWSGDSQAEKGTAKEFYKNIWEKIFDWESAAENLTNILCCMYMLRFGGRLKNAQLEKKLKGLDNSKTTFYSNFYDAEYIIWDEERARSKFVKDITKYDEDDFPINDDYKYQVTNFKGLYNFIKENYDELYKLVYNTKNLGLENVDSISAKTAVNILTKELKERILEPTKYNLDLMKQYLPAFE